MYICFFFKNENLIFFRTEIHEANIAHIESAAKCLELLQDNQQEKQSLRAGDHLKLFRRTKILTVHLESVNDSRRHFGVFYIYRNQLNGEVFHNLNALEFA